MCDEHNAFATETGAWKVVYVFTSEGRSLGSLHDVRQAFEAFYDQQDAWADRNGKSRCWRAA